MPSSNLIKLAPTLSAEERFKIIVMDFHREITGEKSVFSESERQAIIRCENRLMWEDYTHRIGIMQWADAFWTKDIEMEKLRVFACSLLLGRAVDQFFEDSFIPIPEKIQEISCADIKKNIEMFEWCARKFYAYREAIIVIERELYGMPLFNERKKKVIASFYEAVDEMFENYNRRIQMLCESNGARKRLRPIAENPKSYIAKKPVPSKEFVDELVKEIMDIVGSEMEMLGR
jgi:hypothetical protein